MPAEKLRDIVPRSDAITVDVLTPLVAFTAVLTATHLRFARILFYAINTGAVAASVTLETSEDGVRPDSAATETKTCQPGEQVSFEFGSTLRAYWRMSAQTVSGSTTIVAGIKGASDWVR